MRTTTSTMFLLFAMASAAVAQDKPGQPAPPEGRGGPERRMMRMGPPPFDWWRNSEIAQKLNLTDQQKQQLEQTFTQAKTQLDNLRTAAETEEVKLHTLLNADPIQENAVVAQIDATQMARSRLGRTFAMLALQFRKILTADQWKQLQQQDIMRFHKREEGRPGPPPGGPPND